ncbi:response regulator receiver domain-containing protein [Litoreibacter ponti]|uniref:Response regulator receiver domain-containing protein n=1 Tax=Litoreibacter ponti TaxID=1510457 RepID=A0A2T6BDP5_9RHOB|nr:response regulator [Litoreibacter ponti]PTX54180.1 response regulator receiver domain-containing protein [Litoreibacter ponti]
MNSKSDPGLGRVMLVDDESFDQMMYKRILGRSKMAQEILSFTYADEALEYLSDPANPPVDLILLDINMPRMSGFEFLEAAELQLGPRFRAAVVIMLTTSLSVADQARAAQFNAVKAYFNKPLEPSDLEVAAKLVQGAMPAA